MRPPCRPPSILQQERARRDPAYRRSAGHNSDPQYLRGKKPCMKRVTAISPYSEAVDAAEHCFFAEGGIETIAGAHLDITDGFRLTESAPESMFDLRLGAAVKRAHDPLVSM